MKKSVLAYPLLASMALVSVPAWGQDQASNDDNEIVFADRSLSEIIVTGLPASLGDGAYNATEISIDSLQTVENALRDVPGLQQFRRSDARLIHLADGSPGLAMMRWL
jgi:vitamin B12 transporter